MLLDQTAKQALFCGAILGVLSCFANILLSKKEQAPRL